MPEGPAVARGRALQRRAELVDRAGLAAVAEERTVGADGGAPAAPGVGERRAGLQIGILDQYAERDLGPAPGALHRRQRRFVRSEEHTSELQSLMRISYAVFCLKKKYKTKQRQHQH